MAPPAYLDTQSLASPVDMGDGEHGGERTPTDAVVYKPRGLGLFTHSQKDKDDEKHGALAASWWGSHARSGSRPWHNSPK